MVKDQAPRRTPEHLGLGELDDAERLATEAVRVAAAQGHRLNEAFARLALAQVLVGSDRAIERIGEATDALGHVWEYARATGASGFVPLVHLELAELARLRGDETGRSRELREAYRRFTTTGASGHARRLEQAFGRDSSGVLRP
jgi:hypothetical protein